MSVLCLCVCCVCVCVCDVSEVIIWYTQLQSHPVHTSLSTTFIRCLLSFYTFICIPLFLSMESNDVEKEKQGSSSFRLSGPIATWNDGSRSHDQQTLTPSSSSSVSSSKLLTKNNEKIKNVYSEKEKFIEKKEKEFKIEETQNFKEIEEFRTSLSSTFPSSSSSSSSPSSSSSLPTSTYPILHDLNESIDSKSFNDKIDNNRKKKNGSEVKINENNNVNNNENKDFAESYTSVVRNLEVQSLSDDGKLLIIDDVDWKWQQGHFNEMNNRSHGNRMKNNKNKGGNGFLERNEGTKEMINGRDQDRLNLIRDIKQEEEEKEERTSFMSPYLRGLTHICIHFMSYSAILNEVAANAHSLPNIISLRLFNNGISTLKQVTHHF